MDVILISGLNEKKPKSYAGGFDEKNSNCMKMIENSLWLLAHSRISHQFDVYLAVLLFQDVFRIVMHCTLCADQIRFPTSRFFGWKFVGVVENPCFVVVESVYLLHVRQNSQ